MSQNKSYVPMPYRIVNKGCGHPAKFFNVNTGCVFQNCDNKDFIREELDHEECIDQVSGVQLCVQCNATKDLEKGLCPSCRKKTKK